MKKELMDILACPMCKGDLELNVTEVSDSVDEVTAGTLYCKKCDEYYSIEDGIPNMLPPNLRD